MKHNQVRQIDSVYEKSIRDNIEMEQINDLNSFLKVNSRSIVKEDAKEAKTRLKKFDKERNLKISRGEKSDLNNFTMQNDYMVYMPKRNYFESTSSINDKLSPNKINILQNAGTLGFNSLSLSNSHSNKVDDRHFSRSDQIKLSANFQKNNKIAMDNEEIDFMRFKSNFLLKFANNHESYDKLLNNFNIVSLANQKVLREHFKNIKSLSDKKERILFDSSGSNGNNKIQSMVKDCTELFYDFGFFWLRLSEVLFKEVKLLKDENMSLLKRLKNEEISKDCKEEEIQKLSKFIQDNDLNYKSIVNGKKFRDLNEIKEHYEKQGKINLLSTYRLEEEIRELTSLLEKEREFYNKYQDSQVTIHNKKKEVEEMRTKFSQEMEEKKIRISFLNNEKNEFIKKILSMEKELKDYQDTNESSKKEHIEFHTQIKILRQSLTEKEENIQMVTEEVKQWMYEYMKARENNFNSQQTVSALEIKINAMKRERSKG